MNSQYFTLKTEFNFLRCYILISCVALAITILPVFQGYNQPVNKAVMRSLVVVEVNGKDNILLSSPILYSMYRMRIKNNIPTLYSNKSEIKIQHCVASK